MDDILREWTATYDHMLADLDAIAVERDEATAGIRAQIDALEAQLAPIEVPFDMRAIAVGECYRSRLAELEAAIRPLAIVHGKSYAVNGARVAFRSGYTKVTFDAARTDTVLATLRDVLPGTAAALQAARKESHVEPSVKVERV